MLREHSDSNYLKLVDTCLTVQLTVNFWKCSCVLEKDIYKYAAGLLCNVLHVYVCPIF